MKSFLVLALIFAIYFIASVYLYKKAVHIKTKLLYILIPVYLILIYVYYEVVNLIHNSLRDNDIFVEFGHASIRLIGLLILSYLTALVFIVSLAFARKKATSSND